MVNEWNVVELYGANNDGQQRSYIVADAISILKGTLCKLIDPRTASGAVTGAVGTPCAGIAAMDKEVSDGSTTISLYTQGVFDAVSSGAITLGAPISMAEDNMVIISPTNASGANVIGYCLETAANAERVNVRVDL